MSQAVQADPMRSCLLPLAAGPLTGYTIVVTRPAGQAAELTERLRHAGAQVLPFPLLAISPLSATELPALQQALDRLHHAAMAVFVSPNAVHAILPKVLAHGPWPLSVRAACIGPGTRQALADYQIPGPAHPDPVLCPSARYDSEGLLELAACQSENLRGRPVLIFRGDGGRELLAETLSARGARVTCLTSYHRSGPPQPIEELLAFAGHTPRLLLTLSSSEALDYLVAPSDSGTDCSRDTLLALPLFAPHPRIAAKARARGFHTVIETAAADAGLLAGLCAFTAGHD